MALVRCLGAPRNVLQQLQKSRSATACGIYWWPIKPMPKRLSGREQLYMLGSYQDQETAALVPHMGLADTLAAAFEEYALQRHPPAQGWPGRDARR